MHVETARGTGPGGQHRNTRDTAVRAWHEDYPEIVVTRNSGRSQTVNVDDALVELAERIAALQVFGVDWHIKPSKTRNWITSLTWRVG